MESTVQYTEKCQQMVPAVGFVGLAEVTWCSNVYIIAEAYFTLLSCTDCQSIYTQALYSPLALSL